MLALRQTAADTLFRAKRVDTPAGPARRGPCARPGGSARRHPRERDTMPGPGRRNLAASHPTALVEWPGARALYINHRCRNLPKDVGQAAGRLYEGTTMKDDQGRTIPDIDNILEAYAVVANRVASAVVGAEQGGKGIGFENALDVQLLLSLSAAVEAIGSEYRRGLAMHGLASAHEQGTRRIVQ